MPYENDWITNLGKFKIVIDDQEYVMMIGYVPASTKLYVRVWDQNNNYIMGGWPDFYKEVGNFFVGKKAPPYLLNKIMEIVKRYDKMRAFT